MKVQATLMTACVVLLSLPRVSVATEIPFKHAAIDDSVKNPWAKIVADMDGDGFPDLVAGGQNGPLVWYRYPAWDKQILSTKGSHYIRAGDLGADGDVDLIGANWSGPYQPVEVWENRSGESAR